MSKRQALGVLTNNTNGGYASSKLPSAANGKLIKTNASSANSLTGQVCLKSSSSNNNLLLNQIHFNDENEQPQFVLSSLKTQGNHFDFEIFQENKVQPQNQRQQQQSLVNENQNEASKPKHVLKDVNSCFASTRQATVGEKQSKKEEQKEEETENDGDYEDVNDDDDDDDNNDDNEDDEEESDLHKENEEALEEEEEGISRLNLASINSNESSNSCTIFSEKANSSHNELMMIMDSSSSTHSDSPMMLDDTIKFISKIEDHEENDEDAGEYDEEDDEETRRKLDAAERENVLMNCLEYKDEILSYMKQLEKEQQPKSNYMKKQLDITSSMRSILVDWLVEVCEEYKLHLETLYLAVNYTDRFLSQMSVLRGKLQLVGTASMYIASKYEEITPPDVNEFVYITDDTYTKKQVLRMEHLLLKVLDFRMSPPTINWFLSHYLRFIKIQTSFSQPHNADLFQRLDNLARYLAELTLIDSDTYLSYLPSQIASSAIYLALYTLGRPWTKQIADICGYAYDLTELKSCIQAMFKTMQAASTHAQQAIQEKYKQSKYDYVALIEPPKLLASFITQ